MLRLFCLEMKVDKTDNCCGPQIKQKACPTIGTVPTLRPRNGTARPPEKQTDVNEDVWQAGPARYRLDDE